MTEYPARRGPAIAPIHPGLVLRDTVLPALKMGVKEAAAELGISRQMLHRILNGTATITAETALRIGKFCGNGPTLWLNLQQTHDLWHAERLLRAEIGKIPTHKAA
jgi:antitoxin HigA-1